MLRAQLKAATEHASSMAILYGGSMNAAINRLLLALWCAMPSRWFRRGIRK